MVPPFDTGPDPGARSNDTCCDMMKWLICRETSELRNYWPQMKSKAVYLAQNSYWLLQVPTFALKYGFMIGSIDVLYYKRVNTVIVLVIAVGWTYTYCNYARECLNDSKYAK